MTQQIFGKSYGGSAPENYEKYFVPAIPAPLARDLMAAAQLRPQESVLDVACGTGVVARLAAEQLGRGARVAGLDLNPGMLAVARAVTPPGLGIEWYETPAEAMPLGDAAFDVVLCQLGMQFFSDRAAGLREIRRVLAPGGRVVASLPGPTPPLFAAMADAMTRHINTESAGFVHAVFSLHDPGQLRELFDTAGFREIDVRTAEHSLTLPPPREFLWQYVISTPLAGRLAQAEDAARDALEREVCDRWQRFVTRDGMRLDLRMTTVIAR